MPSRPRAAPRTLQSQPKRRMPPRGATELWRLAAPGPTPDAIRAVEQGLPIAAIDELRQVLRSDEIDRLVIPRRTLTHRRLHGEPLSAEESDRALRIARVIKAAAAALGSEVRALDWLRDEHDLLGGRVPLTLSKTDAGARLIENMLARLAWGAAL